MPNESGIETKLYPLKKYCAVNSHPPNEKVYIYATKLSSSDIFLTLIDENAPSSFRFRGVFNINDWGVYEVEADK